MADLARALQTPVPATQPAPQQPASRTPAGPDPRASEYPVQDIDAKRDAKNKRDQERRKAKRAADLKAAKAAEKKAAVPKKKKRRSAKVARARVAAQIATSKKKARGRGRPPGSKNKPKAPLMDTVFPVKVPSASVPNVTVTSTTTPLSIVVAMARMTPMERVEALAAIRAAFFDV